MKIAKTKNTIAILFFVLVMSLIIMGEVVKNNDKPLKGEWSFKPEKVWEISSFENDPLAMIQRFIVAEDGRVYVFDRRNFKFFVFDDNGKPLHKFGTRGEGPGEIRFMLDFYLVNNKIIVYDMGKVSYLDLEGKFLKSQNVNSTVGVAPFLFLDENRFLKSRTKMGPGAVPESLEVFDIPSGKSTFLAGNPQPPAKNPPRGISIRISIGSGRLESNPSFVVGKVGKQILWGMNDSYQIKSCDFEGSDNFSFSLEGRGRNKISQAYKKRAASRINIRGGGDLDAERKRYMQSIPDECTYFSRITSDKNGLIYVYVSDAEKENGQAIDIFSPEGKFLYKGEISLPEDNRIIANGVVIKGDYLYMVVEDEEGEFTLNKYKIQLPQG